MTAVVTKTGGRVQVAFAAADHELECEFEDCGDGPSPIAPEVKELAWGAGAFIVLALLMRFVLYPRLKQGTDARYALIRGEHEQADAARAAAQAEVADYEAALVVVKAEAHERIEAARQTLESERQARLAEVNAAVTAKRDAAAAAARAARESAQADVAAAVAEVTARTIELSTGRAPDAAVVRSSVDDVMSAGVAS